MFCVQILRRPPRLVVAPRTIVAFSLFYSVSIAVGRSSFVTALLQQRVSAPLCHSVVLSTRSGSRTRAIEREREESESKEKRERETRLASGSGTLVFPSCVTVVHPSSITL